MILWLFWPSFCSAIVSPDKLQLTAVNTILALCGATLATFVVSSLLRGGKTHIADIANATLAGGVSIGSTCDIVSPQVAFLIGVGAGLLCTVGFIVIQSRLEKKLGLVDTCGVHNLHGMPGLFGGLVAIAVVPGVAVAQLLSILVVLIIALVGGTVCGIVLKLTGTKQMAYDDAEEFVEVEEEAEAADEVTAEESFELPTAK